MIINTDCLISNEHTKMDCDILKLYSDNKTYWMLPILVSLSEVELQPTRGDSTLFCNNCSLNVDSGILKFLATSLTFSFHF